MMIRNPLELDALSLEDPLHRDLTKIIDRAMGRSAQQSRPSDPSAPDAKTPFWNASFFGLDRSSLYQSLSFEKQKSVLSALSAHLISEAWSIEKCGMTFGARMALLSESQEERILYSTISSDEARHFQTMSRYKMNAENAHEESNSFLGFLAQIIQNEPKSVLVFVIQVLLEGWGLTHYTNMAAHCENTAFAEDLRQILRDEARHHGSGIVLFDWKGLSQAEKDHISSIYMQFLRMVQCGPQAVVSAMDEACSGLSNEQRIRLFSELDCESLTAERLERLKSLCDHSGAQELSEKMEKLGYLRAFSPQECAEVA